MRVDGRQSRSYLTNLEKVVPRPSLNGNTDYCPRCGGYLVRDLNDLDCFICGWRECSYFRLGDSINEGIIRELIYNRRIPSARIYIRK